FYAVLPEWVDRDFPVNIEDIQWAGSEGLVVWLYSREFNASYGLVNYYYVDVSTGGITPLFDFSGLSSPADIFQPDSEGQTPFSRFPRVGVTAPDGSAFFYIHYEELGSNMHISALPLPPGTGEPQQLGLLETFEGRPDPHPTIAENGKAYMFTYVMQFER
ncbi:MAG: hypothetical protein K8I82_20175, partial [Anaerolineae bacterium]|nr:hypothetical protein [Anaerolineae bacterium]